MGIGDPLILPGSWVQVGGSPSALLPPPPPSACGVGGLRVWRQLFGKAASCMCAYGFLLLLLGSWGLGEGGFFHGFIFFVSSLSHSFIFLPFVSGAFLSPPRAELRPHCLLFLWGRPVGTDAGTDAGPSPGSHRHAWHLAWGTWILKEGKSLCLGSESTHARGSLGLLPWEEGGGSQRWGGMMGEPCTPQAPAALLILTSASPAFPPQLFPK